MRAGWLVGADGARSRVRQTLGLLFDGVTEPGTFLLADAVMDWPLPADEIAIFWHRAGVMAYFPVRPGIGRIVASVDVGRDAPPSLDDVRVVVAERGSFGAVAHETTWRSRSVINERKVPDYRGGRCFVVGDAAHIHSPAGGQGMNTGMQDAANLAWKLAAVLGGLADPEPLLASYCAERSPVAEHVLAMAGRMTRVATMRGGASRRLRDRLARVVLALPPARRRLRDDLSELGVADRASPIVRDAGAGRRGLRAGDRLPDAPLPGPSGRVRLHERMRDSTPTLLLLVACRGPRRSPACSRSRARSGVSSRVWIPSWSRWPPGRPSPSRTPRGWSG